MIVTKTSLQNILLCKLDHILYPNCLSLFKIPTHTDFKMHCFIKRTSYSTIYFHSTHIREIHNHVLKRFIARTSKPYEMLPINLIGSMKLLPMNFIFDLITKTCSPSTFNQNPTNLSQILIRSYRSYMIVLPNTLFNINKSFVNFFNH